MNPNTGPAADFLRSITALGHYGHTDDVAALVAHPAGAGGQYVTGTVITIDGGLAAGAVAAKSARRPVVPEQNRYRPLAMICGRDWLDGADRVRAQ